MQFQYACQEIAKRYNRRFGGSCDAETVKYHAYSKVRRCTTIRLIAKGITD